MYGKHLAPIVAALLCISLFAGCKSQEAETEAPDSGAYDVVEEQPSAANSAADTLNTSEESSAEQSAENPPEEQPDETSEDTDRVFHAKADIPDGVWVDENGFVMLSEGGEVTLRSGISAKSFSVTETDENTITVCGRRAVKSDSAEGRELLSDFGQKLHGEWTFANFGFSYVFKDNGKLVLRVYGEDYSEEEYSLDGACILLYSGTEFESAMYAAVENDTLYMTEGEASIPLYRKGSEAEKAALEKINREMIAAAAKELCGEWYNEASGEIWRFDESGALFVDNKAREFSLFVDDMGEVCAEFDGKEYSLSSWGTLTFTRDGETITLVSTDSDEYRIAKQKERLETEAKELLSRYPDNDGWTERFDVGDIPFLADADYIEKSAAAGIFYVSTPEELASCCWFVNTCNSLFMPIMLQNDIDLAGYRWAPMGWNGGANDHPFAGFVDGGNHTIRNMTVPEGFSDAGFIGWETYCRVQNIRFENAFVEGSNAGVVSGQAIGGAYENIYVSGTVKGYSAGSMLGYDANTTKNNCEADVIVNGEKFDFLSWNEKRKSEIVVDNMVEITMDEDHTVHRPEVEGYRNLGWMVFYNGEQVLHRNAENELSYRYFLEKSGEYEIYLTAYVEGQYVPISNTVRYTIP